MITIQGIRIADDVLTTKFACDYTECQGACCHVDSDDYEGCEITSAEAALIKKHKEELAALSTNRVQKHIILKSPTYKNSSGTFVSVMAKGKCCLECSGHCALNTLRHNGVLHHGNPIACALYPLVYKDRVLTIGHYYDKMGLCKPGYDKGTRDNILMVEFCKDSLIRKFGEKFYTELINYIHYGRVDDTTAKQS